MWLRVGLVVVLFALTFFAAKSCQQSQVRITKDQAIARAEGRVPFEPTHVQVRMLRQGSDVAAVLDRVALGTAREGRRRPSTNSPSSA